MLFLLLLNILKKKMKDPNFEYTAKAKTRFAKEQYDFSQQI